jgi:parvulin-like peptidyl-prolyl isomerase
VARGADFLQLGDADAAVLLSDGIFGAPKGAVSEPVVAGGYAYLFFVHEKLAGAKRTFDEVRPQVEQAYRRMKAQSAYANVLDEQLRSGDVEMFPERM